MPVTENWTRKARIDLKGVGRREEGKALAAINPGHLLMRGSSNADYQQTVKKHDNPGGVAERMFALGDHLQGKTITDAYATDELVSVWMPNPGDTVYAKVAAGAAAITLSDVLVSAGDGTLKKGAGSNELVYNSVADSASITNVTAETDFDKTYTFPANALKAGQQIVIEGSARATATNSTDTLTIKVKIGSTQLATSGAVDVANNDVCQFRIVLTIIDVGATGHFTASGYIGLGAAGTVTMKALYVDSTAIDTTVSQLVKVTGQWSAQSTGDVVVLEQLSIRQVSLNGENIIAVPEEAKDNSAGVAEAFIRARVL